MKILRLIFGLCILLGGTHAFAQGVSIDSLGNVETGALNSSGTLEVDGQQDSDAVVGTTTGIGSAIHGENLNMNGHAGYFQGNAHVTGDLTVDGKITNSGMGDIQGVTAGTGLTGGGVSGTVTLDADVTYLQRRVSSTCSVGSSIKAINEDGTVTCESDADTVDGMHAADFSVSASTDINQSNILALIASLQEQINSLQGSTSSNPQWQPAVLIETDNAENAYMPQVAMDAQGNAIAVWHQNDGTRYNIWSNRYTAGAGWSTAELIETDNAGDAAYPQVAMDAQGNAIAVWYQFDGTLYNIWSNRYTAGTGWGTAVLLETDAGTAGNPQVAMDAQGNATVVWQQHDGTRYSIVSISYIAGTGWWYPVLIETDTGTAGNPQVAMDAQGNAVAVWQQYDGTRNNIWANRYTGMSWGAAVLIETDNSGNATYPQVAMDALGNAVAVWQQDDGTRNNIWTNRYVAGTGWGAAELIETDNAGNATYPQVAMDEQGNAIAVWQQNDGTRDNIWSNRYMTGTGWGTAVLIETDDTGTAGNPQVVMHAQGNAIAVWQQNDGTRDNIWSNRYTAGTGWSTAELIELDNAGNAGFPQIAMDAQGNAIAVWHQNDGTRDSIFSSYIPGAGWGPETLIETETGNVIAPQVAMDAQGNAIAVWHQHDGTRYNIWANRYTAGTGWGAAVLIETDNAGSAYLPQVAMDAQGNAIAVWQQNDGTRDNIWANRYTAGAGWGTAVLIETDNTGTAGYPQVAMDAQGNATAAWQQNDGTRYNIWTNRYRAGVGWGTAVLIEIDNAGHAYYPQVAMDAQGNAIAAWQQNDGTRYNIWSNRYTAGTGWGTAVLLETDNTWTTGYPQVAMDAQGNAIAVWGQYDGTRNNIWANRYTAGAGWGTAVLIETNDAGDAGYPQVAMDTQGNAITVWYQHDGTRYNVWSNRYRAGTGWGAAVLIETNDAGNAVNPQVAMDAQGNAIAVWEQWDGTRYNIWANKYGAGAGWGPAVLIETENTWEARNPQVAMDLQGNAIAVWRQWDGTNNNVWAKRYRISVNN